LRFVLFLKMFFKLAALTLIVPLISALTLSTPENLSSGGSATINWTSAAGDPSTFSIELLNVVFHNSFAIANNVQPSAGTITLTLPSVPPGDGYTLEAVDISNITNVYATSGSFSIAAESTVTSTSSSTSGRVSSTSSISYTPPATSSAYGTTNTSPVTTSTSSVSTTSGTGTASTPKSSNFNAALAMKFGINTGAMSAILLSVVAGAFVIAL